MLTSRHAPGGTDIQQKLLLLKRKIVVKGAKTRFLITLVHVALCIIRLEKRQNLRRRIMNLLLMSIENIKKV